MPAPGSATPARAASSSKRNPSPAGSASAPPGQGTLSYRRSGLVSLATYRSRSPSPSRSENRAPRPYVEVGDLESRLHADLAERHAPAVGAPLVQVEQVADPRVGVGEPLRGPGDGAVHVGVAGDEQVGPAVAVDVADGGPGVPAEGRGAGVVGPFGERPVALVPQERAAFGAGHVQVGVAVEVEVRRHAAVAPDVEIGAGAVADVDEGALDVVEQGACGAARPPAPTGRSPPRRAS